MSSVQKQLNLTCHAQSQHPNNRIEINLAGDSFFYEDEWVSLHREGSAETIFGIVRHNPNCGPDEIRTEDFLLSLFINRPIESVGDYRINGDSMMIVISKLASFSLSLGIRKQMGLSAGKALMLNESVIAKMKADGIEQIRVFHEMTGATIDYALSNCISGSMEEQAFLINYYERELLCLREPMFIKKSFWQAMPETVREGLASYYTEDGNYAVLQKKPTHNQWQTIRNYLREAGYYQLSFLPIQKCQKKSIKNWLKALYMSFFKWIIGTKTVQLSVIRPLPIDETAFVCRLSQSSFDMLGIEPGEKVIISYGKKQVSLRAHLLSDVTTMNKVNVALTEDRMAYVIGLPSHIRRMLRIGDLNAVIDIERDASYLFWKKSHLQILPLIGLLISIITITVETAMRVVLFCILGIISIYVMMSEERSKII
ncbi:MAG: hypothetical protein PWP51_1867 [Clostridiales bacterium]|nr:hypothetical protein [Clostridiales bacterium]MDN5299314.1 hypothetical protein [Clostridiales bacterium]